MSKCLTAGMIGYLLGMKHKQLGKQFCIHHLQKRMLRILKLF